MYIKFIPLKADYNKVTHFFSVNVYVYLFFIYNITEHYYVLYLFTIH